MWIACLLTVLWTCMNAPDAVPPDSATGPCLSVSVPVPSDEPNCAITGVVRYEGKPAAMRPINMDADPTCAEKHADDPALNESLVVGDDGGLANVFVQITEGFPDKVYPVPETPVTLSQAGCVYRPRVFGVRAGQTLRLLNPDGTMHNVNAMPKVNQGFNKPMDRETEQSETVFARPEPIFPIKCDVHPWMRAYCAVMAHPFFAVTKENGAFSIAGLPPGEYTLEVWHERLGTQSTRVTVTADATAQVDFVFAR